MEDPQRTTIQSQSEAAIWLKFVVPAMLVAGSVGIFGKNALTWRFVFVIPFVALAFFLLSLGIVRISNGTVRYRRFFRWTTIGANEVVDRGLVWPGVIGYVRLNHRVRPWGRLYIVLDESFPSSPFPGGGHALLKHLGGRGVPQQDESSTTGNARRFPSNLVSLIAGFAGILFYLVWRLISDHGLKSPFGTTEAPGDLVLLRFFHLLGTFQVTLVFFSIFAFLAVYKRHQDKSWTFAFLTGGLLAHALFLWLTR